MAWQQELLLMQLSMHHQGNVEAGFLNMSMAVRGFPVVPTAMQEPNMLPVSLEPVTTSGFSIFPLATSPSPQAPKVHQYNKQSIVILCGKIFASCNTLFQDLESI